MSDLTEHYRLLLGLDEAWVVSQVDLAMAEKKVEIQLTHRGGRLVCPDCGAGCSQADLAPERQWRHLDNVPLLCDVPAECLPAISGGRTSCSLTISR